MVNGKTLSTASDLITSSSQANQTDTGLKNGQSLAGWGWFVNAELLYRWYSEL